MNENSSKETPNSQQTPADDARLERLTKRKAGRPYNERYSKAIRWLRLILPVIALGIAAVVFTWSNMETKTKILTEAQAPKSIGKNELLNPKFESTDEKKQPYTITAKRALQGETNEDLVILEEPLGDMLLSSGNWVAIQADQGAFRQDNKRLFLKGSVKLFHDDGYQMTMPELYIDMENNTAWSDHPVQAQGPAGTINATGLKANSESGHLIFSGPAKAVLTGNTEILPNGP